MKAIILASVFLSAVATWNGNTAAEAKAVNRQNCRLTNAGGCVKLGNGWMEFCPSIGAERIDRMDKNDADCVSVKPFSLVEFNSQTNQRFVVKQGTDAMDFQPIGGYSAHTFTTDCSDLSVPCAVEPASIDAVKFTVAMNTTDSASPSQVMIDLFVFSQGGTLAYDGANYVVAPGSFKFDIRSDNYIFVNPDCDGVAIQVEMKTLGGDVGAQTITRNATSTFVDTVMRSPNRFVFEDTGAAAGEQQWGSAGTLLQSASGKRVVSFEMGGIPNNGTFRFDPFVNVPAPRAENGAEGLLASPQACAALAAIMTFVVGLFAM